MPFPDTPELVNDNQLSEAVADHDVLAVTVMLDVPPDAANPSVEGLNDAETSMFPQSLLLNVDPAELTVSTQ